MAVDRLTPGSPPPPGQVQAFGLNMPPGMFVRILAAARGLYPNETAGKTDAAAAQAALKSIIVDLVTRWEVSNATPPLADIIRQATDDASAQQRAASNSAQTDGNNLIQPSVTT